MEFRFRGNDVISKFHFVEAVISGAAIPGATVSRTAQAEIHRLSCTRAPDVPSADLVTGEHVR